MLSRKALSAAGAVLATVLAVSVVSIIDGNASATPAAQTIRPAGQIPSCVGGVGSGTCTQSGSSPGNPGSSGGNSSGPGQPGGTPTCSFMNVTIPCHIDQDGDYGGDGCYYALWPQPWPDGPWNTDPVAWKAKHPTGSVYHKNCLLSAEQGIGGPILNWDATFRWQWLDNPPGQNIPRITPAQAAADFIATLKFNGPSISVAPPSGSTVLVGMAMYLWSPNTVAYWGPNDFTTNFEGYAISLDIRATGITWYPGDGSSFDCDHGSAPGSGGSTCSHTYTTSSAQAAGQTYQAYGVTHWQIKWQAGGQNNFNNPVLMDEQSANPVAIKVGEAQAVVQH